MLVLKVQAHPKNAAQEPLHQGIRINVQIVNPEHIPVRALLLVQIVQRVNGQTKQLKAAQTAHQEVVAPETELKVLVLQVISALPELPVVRQISVLPEHTR